MRFVLFDDAIRSTMYTPYLPIARTFVFLFGTIFCGLTLITLQRNEREKDENQLSTLQHSCGKSARKLKRNLLVIKMTAMK